MKYNIGTFIVPPPTPAAEHNDPKKYSATQPDTNRVPVVSL
jgi:hypothetical protein